MKGAYSTYFDNLFLSLRMARPEFKAQAQYSLRTIRQAALGAAFTPLLTELETAITGFDENLTDSNQSTAGGTEAFHKARTKWLEFVDDTMKDYVTPKLRKLPSYADFKKFGKSKFARLDQSTLLTNSKVLLDLYKTHQNALYPDLGADAQKFYDALDTADDTRDQQDGDISEAQLGLADDRAAALPAPSAASRPSSNSSSRMRRRCTATSIFRRRAVTKKLLKTLSLQVCPTPKPTVPRYALLPGHAEAGRTSVRSAFACVGVHRTEVRCTSAVPEVGCTEVRLASAIAEVECTEVRWASGVAEVGCTSVRPIPAGVIALSFLLKLPWLLQNPCS